MVRKIPYYEWVSRILYVTFTASLFVVISGCAGPQIRPTYRDGSVLFSIEAPESAEVSLVLLQKDAFPPTLEEYPTVIMKDGLHETSVRLAPGEYHYFFRMNGKTVVDPKAPRVEKDGFGGSNGVFALERKSNGSVVIY